MDIALKRNQSFRLPVDLIERLKLLAKQQNRSLNNYVETLLLDAAYLEPNAETIEAMKEAERHMECHIDGDFLLIWFDPDTDEIDLVRYTLFLGDATIIS